MSDSCPTHPHTDGSTMVGTKMLLMMKLLMMLLMLVRLTMMRRGAVSLDHAPWPAPQDLGRVGEDVTALQSAFDEVRPSFLFEFAVLRTLRTICRSHVSFVVCWGAFHGFYT